VIHVILVGIDLAGSEKRRSGVCILRNRRAEFRSVHTDNEILDIVKDVMPKCVGIDAPLSYHDKPFRDGDIEIRKRGYRILPLTFKGMRRLAERGMRLAKHITHFSEVIEVYPHASFRVLNISDIISEIGMPSAPKNKDEFDALICALTA